MGTLCRKYTTSGFPESFPDVKLATSGLDTAFTTQAFKESTRSSLIEES